VAPKLKYAYGGKLIRYWLPELSKHKHIALLFLPQREYQAAAPMIVTPVPDVMTRVFMLFKGIGENELESWDEARGKSDQGPDVWRDIVGVDVEKAQNEELFRVLEWGGMEVI
jgi:hypothetical protein